MTGILREPLAELLGVLVYAALAVVLAIAGTMAEFTGVQDLMAGATVLGLWKTAAGLVVLYAALSIAREFVLTRDATDGTGADETQ